MTLFYYFVLQLESYGPWLPLNWAIPEKKKQGGVENVEFPGVLKKYHVDFPGVNNKKNGISRGDREEIMWIFQGS